MTKSIRPVSERNLKGVTGFDIFESPGEYTGSWKKFIAIDNCSFKAESVYKDSFSTDGVYSTGSEISIIIGDTVEGNFSKVLIVSGRLRGEKL